MANITGGLTETTEDTSKTPIVGGYGPTMEANEGFVIVCFQFKTRVQALKNKKYEDFTAISYRFQIVAGINYIFKVHVGGENYIHVKMFWALPCYGGELELLDVQENKTKTDPIEPF